jgi:hypothetical protein
MQSLNACKKKTPQSANMRLIIKPIICHITQHTIKTKLLSNEPFLNLDAFDPSLLTPRKKKKKKKKKNPNQLQTESDQFQFILILFNHLTV